MTARARRSDPGRGAIIGRRPGAIASKPRYQRNRSPLREIPGDDVELQHLRVLVKPIQSNALSNDSRNT
jgi:hypothetical protein